jgi:hypothetical protein
MSDRDKNILDRRQFLQRWLRRGLLGALTAAGLTLVVRGQTCAKGGICGGCALLSHCALPPAEDYRRLQPNRLP